MPASSPESPLSPDEIHLIRIYGSDQAGLTSKITALLMQHHASILDIGQAVIHNNLALGILVQLPDEQARIALFDQLLNATQDLNIKLRFQNISFAEYSSWVNKQETVRFIVTVLARSIEATHLNKISRALSSYGFNIEDITRLSERVNPALAQSHNRACIELTVSGDEAQLNALKADFTAIAHNDAVDIAFQRDNAYRRNRRLVVFDMDSTLIQAEVIDELAKEAGVGEQVSEITERAMQGKINFNDSFTERLALLEGLSESVLEKVSARLQLTEGAERLMRTLKALGYKTAIISGGFTYFGHYLQDKLGIDFVFANHLEIHNGKCTGKVSGDIIDGAKKAEILQQLAEQQNLNLQQVIAIGDGANDVPMLNKAGLGIAFRAKPLVRENTEHAISTLGLDGVLYLLGVRDRDHNELG